MEFKTKNIGIEVTSICNTECIMCPRGSRYKGPKSTMPLDLFKKSVIDLHDNKVEKLVPFAGMGDPSCDRLLIERLRFCRQRTPNLDIVVDSNMGVWSRQYTDIIVGEKLLSKIHFSVFAATEEASFKIHRNRSQAMNARENIEYFIKKNEEAGHPVQTIFYTLLLDENKDEMNLFKEIYWDKVDEFEIWAPHSWSNLYPNLRKVQKERRKCYRIEDFEASIRVNGDVCACCMDINHNLVYGNLRTQTIEEIYGSEPYRHLRDLNRAGHIETLDTCRNCTFLNADESEVLIESKMWSRRGKAGKKIIID